MVDKNEHEVYVKFTHINSSIGIVHKDVQSSILLFLHLIKEILDFQIICRITAYRKAAASTIFDLKTDTRVKQSL